MILISSGHYAVVEWEYGSEEGQIHMDGVRTEKQARALAYRFLWDKYRVPAKRLHIKGVFVAGKAQGVFREAVGTEPGSDPTPGFSPGGGDRSGR